MSTGRILFTGLLALALAIGAASTAKASVYGNGLIRGGFAQEFGFYPAYYLSPAPPVPSYVAPLLR
jgi:hypothetical protein